VQQGEASIPKLLRNAQRAKQQDNADSNFALIEKRNLFAALSPEWTNNIRRLIVPLRHVEWGANTNNTYLSGYGYGAPFTSAALMHAMDRLGMAQYLTRLALAVNDQDPVILDEGKALWLDDPLWQPLRRLVEDAMVQKDWFDQRMAELRTDAVRALTEKYSLRVASEVAK
jgi:phenol hydroxylase P1 protein